MTMALLATLLTAQQAIFSLPVQSANVNLTVKKSELPFAYIPYISDTYIPLLSLLKRFSLHSS